jgi:hypothetical protein
MSESDLGKMKQVDADAFSKITERSVTYGTETPAWRLMSVDAMLSGVIYKTDRARVTKDLNKKYDDILDDINYLRFVGVLVKEEMERQKKLESTSSN